MPMHTEWEEVKIHTAKCDFCNKHNAGITYRCTSCSSHICVPCRDSSTTGTNGVHILPGRTGPDRKDPSTTLTGVVKGEVDQSRRRTKKMFRRKRVAPSDADSSAAGPSSGRASSRVASHISRGAAEPSSEAGPITHQAPNSTVNDPSTSGSAQPFANAGYSTLPTGNVLVNRTNSPSEPRSSLPSGRSLKSFALSPSQTEQLRSNHTFGTSYTNVPKQSRRRSSIMSGRRIAQPLDGQAPNPSDHSASQLPAGSSSNVTILSYPQLPENQSSAPTPNLTSSQHITNPRSINGGHLVQPFGPAPSNSLISYSPSEPPQDSPAEQEQSEGDTTDSDDDGDDDPMSSPLAQAVSRNQAARAEYFHARNATDAARAQWYQSQRHAVAQRQFYDPVRSITGQQQATAHQAPDVTQQVTPQQAQNMLQQAMTRQAQISTQQTQAAATQAQSGAGAANEVRVITSLR